MGEFKQKKGKVRNKLIKGILYECTVYYMYVINSVLTVKPFRIYVPHLTMSSIKTYTLCMLNYT